MRANVEFFNNWGIELLVTQLHDKSKTISSEALDILDEACEDKVKVYYFIYYYNTQVLIENYVKS